MSDQYRDLFSARGTVNVPVRGVNKGMFRDRAGQIIPDNGAYTLKNYISSLEGPKRRPGYVEFADGEATDYRHIDMATVWKSSDDTQKQILVTTGNVSLIGPFTGYTEVSWEYTTGTCSVDSDTVQVTGSGVDFTADAYDVMVGDIFRVGSEENYINEITGSNSFTLEAALANNYASGTDYSIQRTFNDSSGDLCDVVVAEEMVIMADGRRPLIRYDSSAGDVDWFVTTSVDYGSGEEDFVAGCIAYFGGRMWAADIVTDSDGTKVARIVWSKVTNIQDFSDSDYIDLPFSGTGIQRLVPLGNMLVVYFSTAVWVGIPTNYPDLPLRFEQVQTGGIGLIGKKAVTPWSGGHYFVGQDDIYFFSNEGLERVGSPVVRDTIFKCNVPSRIYATSDPANFRICFGFPENEDYMEKLWHYEYRTGGWGYDDLNSYMIANPVINAQLTWGELTGTWATLGDTYPTWGSFELYEGKKQFYVEVNKVLWKAGTTTDTDPNSAVVTATFESKDYDFGSVDKNKTWLRLGVKINAFNGLGNDLEFTVTVSGDRGNSWKSAGTITIPEGENEGHVNFRQTSSHLRFRLVSGSIVYPYSIDEFVMKVKGRGIEGRPQSTQ